MSQVSAEA